MSKIIEPSLLAFDSASIKSQLLAVKQLGTTYIHYDVMDGKFVPNKSFGTEHLPLINELGLKANVHLMVKKPLTFIKDFINYPLNSIVFHPEGVCKWQTAIICRYLSKHHIPYGLAIHPYSDPDRYQAILKTCDYVLVMGVIPGKGGQAFIPQTIANLIKVKKIKTDFNPKLIIQLDGGVNDQIMQQTANYVDHFIIGTFLMHNPQNMPNVFNLAKQLS